MKDSYRVGVVKYTDHASLNRIEAGTRNILNALAEKHGITINYDGLVFDGQADPDLMKKIALKMVEEKSRPGHQHRHPADRRHEGYPESRRHQHDLPGGI